MEKIYSKKQEGLLLHVIWRIEDFAEGRQNIVSDDEFLQCAALNLNAGQTFRPHRHIQREVTDKDRIPQESWHVIKGRVKCVFYDVDDTVVATPILYEGDTSFTFRGGHTYQILQDNTRVLEYKTGRYLGQKLDKQFINE